MSWALKPEANVVYGSTAWVLVLTHAVASWDSVVSGDLGLASSLLAYAMVVVAVLHCIQWFLVQAQRLRLWLRLLVELTCLHVFVLYRLKLSSCMTTIFKRHTIFKTIKTIGAVSWCKQRHVHAVLNCPAP